MAERKTPILLRRGPLTGDVMALYRYTRAKVRGKGLLDAPGKQSVQADFDAIVLEELLDGSLDDKGSAPDMALILDWVANGELPEDEVPDYREQVARFRARLVAMIERHNAGPHVKAEG